MHDLDVSAVAIGLTIWRTLIERRLGRCVPVSDPTAIDVLANVDAMNYALEDPATSTSPGS